MGTSTHSARKRSHRILVAGVGGASLGTELVKSLLLTRRYRVFGCDISSLAYGHFQRGIEATAVVPRRGYASAVVDLCRRWKIRAVIPGGEEPTLLLGKAKSTLEANGVVLAANSRALTLLCADKAEMFSRLRNLDVQIPQSLAISSDADFRLIQYPCVVKPAVGSGGSSFVFLAKDADEAAIYVNYLRQNGRKPVLQEYVPEDRGGEYSVGVLSLPNGHLVGSIALKRNLESKLSVAIRSTSGVISSGYSQGQFAEFREVRAACEEIALRLMSKGPLNIQGRLRDGRFLPFEINSRFSASTYLRALAGVNEVDLFLGFLLEGRVPTMPRLRPGNALRSFSEVFVPDSRFRA